MIPSGHSGVGSGVAKSGLTDYFIQNTSCDISNFMKLGDISIKTTMTTFWPIPVTPEPVPGSGLVPGGHLYGIP